MPGIVLELVSGLASPLIFLPGLVVGWFARRWWQVVLGAIAIAVQSEAEVLLIELPGAKPDWAHEPMVVIAPLAWCAAGYLLRPWYQRTSGLRPGGSIRALPVVAGMVLGAVVVGALAVCVGLLYLRRASWNSTPINSIERPSLRIMRKSFFSTCFQASF